MLLRKQLSHDWVKYINYIVEAHNNIPTKKLGWFKPNQIHSEFDSILVESEKKKFNIHTYKEPVFKDQILSQNIHEQDSKKIQVNDYVYLDLNEKLFDKSFDIQVYSQFNIFSFHIFYMFSFSSLYLIYRKT